MPQVICLVEQEEHAAIALLKAAAVVGFRPLADLADQGWEHPLVLFGDGLDRPEAQTLIQRVYRNPAPCLVLPPLPLGEVTALLDAPAPVALVRQRADTVELTDETLRELLGRDSLRVYCTEAIETALRTGVLAIAEGRPVIWAYQPTRGATPVAWVAAQLLLMSARTDPLDREELLSALLTWAEAHTRAGAVEVAGERAESAMKEADPGLLRALVVAWSVCPDLTREALPGWLGERLFLQASPAELDTALETLQAVGALDAEYRPQAEQLSALVDAWGLRAWVREARRQAQE